MNPGEWALEIAVLDAADEARELRLKEQAPLTDKGEIDPIGLVVYLQHAHYLER